MNTLVCFHYSESERLISSVEIVPLARNQRSSVSSRNMVASSGFRQFIKQEASLTIPRLFAAGCEQYYPL